MTELLIWVGLGSFILGLVVGNALLPVPAKRRALDRDVILKGRAYIAALEAERDMLREAVNSDPLARIMALEALEEKDPR